MFTWNELAMRNNTELLANLGNFINRTLKFLKAKYNSVVPSFEMDAAKDGPVVKAVNELLQQYIEALEAVKIRHGLQLVMMISAAGNQYLQDNKLDNTLYEKQQPRCRTVMAMSVNLIYLLAALIEPYMPSTSASIYEQLNAPRRTIPDKFEMVVHAGHRLGTPALLFTRIEEKRVQELIAMYGGGESAAATVEEEKSKPKRKPATGGAN